MAIIQKSIATWVLLSFFCSFILIKVEEKSNMNWFLVFTPMWIFNSLLSIFGLIKLFQKSRRTPFFFSQDNLTIVKKELTYLICVFLKSLFEVLLCFKLQYYSSLSLFFVMIPLWILLLIILVFLSMRLYKSHSSA